ncbi:MAG TPA: carboxypeptidase-like regulatory domain-containing protein, partial [Thermoanaerobaculia bacterium]|nr:carboxypeptidase-like regulatory domain-containing protein [Thermoanaerobaculia bacterium]
RELRERHTGSVLQTRTLEPSEELTRAISFDGISPGTYVVHAKGREVSEVAGVEVVVAEIPSVPAHLQILPFTLRVRTGIHGDSKVVLANREGRWETEALLDADGAVDLQLWQGGRLNARVFARGHIPFRATRTVESVDTEWLIEMPERRVTGTVVDGDTGAPISGASLALEMAAAPPSRLLLGSASGIRSDANGEFDLSPVPPGRHTLNVAARGYPETSETFLFEETEETKTLTVRMFKKPITMVTVVDHRGVPISGADVLVFRGTAQITAMRTPPDGMVPVFIDQNEERTVYVLPRDGSFAVAALRSGVPSRTIAVPPGSCRILVRVETEAHDPIEGLTVDVGYDGQILPFEILERLHSRGSRLVSGADGIITLHAMPPGLYELRPIRTPRTMKAPLRFQAVPGENRATMTFAAASRS